MAGELSRRCSLLLTCLGLASVTAASVSVVPRRNSNTETTTTTQRRTIVGGRVADPGRYPYFVRLLYDGVVGCGGTLVWTDLILTAAHCAYPDIDIRQILAVMENGDGELQTSKIHRVIPHPIFDLLMHLSFDWQRPMNLWWNLWMM